MWALSGAIIVWPGYHDMPIPDDIKNHITINRMIIVKSDQDVASDTEAMWYISTTASLVAHLDTYWTNVYM